VTQPSECGVTSKVPSLVLTGLIVTPNISSSSTAAANTSMWATPLNVLPGQLIAFDEYFMTPAPGRLKAVPSTTSPRAV
jgi:hypothetical protein